MKKAVVVFGVVAALFMLTGCPKEKVNVVGAGDGEMVGGSSESTSSISSRETGDLLGSVYFDFDKFVIRPDMQSVVDEIATQAQSQDSIQLVIEGNTNHKILFSL